MTLSQAQALLEAWIQKDLLLAGGVQKHGTDAEQMEDIDAATVTAKVKYYRNLVKELKDEAAPTISFSRAVF